MLVDVETITASDVLAVTLDDAKAWLREDRDVEDDLITSLIHSARAEFESQSGYTLFETTFRQYLTAFPDGAQSIELLRAPLISVDSIEYLSPDEEWVEIDAGEYRAVLRPNPGRVRLLAGASWPATVDAAIEDEEGDGAVRITFKAGRSAESDNSEIPEPVRQAIKALVAQGFRFREPSVMFGGGLSEVPYSVRSIIDQYRIDYGV